IGFMPFPLGESRCAGYAVLSEVRLPASFDPSPLAGMQPTVRNAGSAECEGLILTSFATADMFGLEGTTSRGKTIAQAEGRVWSGSACCLDPGACARNHSHVTAKRCGVGIAEVIACCTRRRQQEVAGRKVEMIKLRGAEPNPRGRFK